MAIEIKTHTKDENINYEEVINKILTIAENSNGEIPATQKIISLYL